MGLLPHRMVGGFVEGAARVGVVVLLVGCHMTVEFVLPLLLRSEAGHVMAPLVVGWQVRVGGISVTW